MINKLRQNISEYPEYIVATALAIFAIALDIWVH